MNLEIVIIDDDKIILFLHKLILDKSGLSKNPISYLHGKEAMNFLIGNQHTDDKYLVFLDIKMPGMNGWEFLDEICLRPFADRVFVIVVTSSIDPREKIRAMSYKNVIDFFEKPIDTLSCNKIRLLPEIAHYFQNSN